MIRREMRAGPEVACEYIMFSEYDIVFASPTNAFNVDDFIEHLAHILDLFFRDIFSVNCDNPRTWRRSKAFETHALCRTTNSIICIE